MGHVVGLLMCVVSAWDMWDMWLPWLDLRQCCMHVVQVSTLPVSSTSSNVGAPTFAAAPASAGCTSLYMQADTVCVAEES